MRHPLIPLSSIALCEAQEEELRGRKRRRGFETHDLHMVDPVKKRPRIGPGVIDRLSLSQATSILQLAQSQSADWPPFRPGSLPRAEDRFTAKLSLAKHVTIVDGSTTDIYCAFVCV